MYDRDKHYKQPVQNNSENVIIPTLKANRRKVSISFSTSEIQKVNLSLFQFI